MMHTFLVRVVILLFLTLTMSQEGRAIPISAQAFGMHVHVLQNDSLPSQLSKGYVRLWDTGTTWRQLEAVRGTWDFAALDKFVAAAEKNESPVLYVFGMTPTWAAKDPTANSYYAKGASSPPSEIADWRNYVRTVATRYKGRIRHWELWNEANNKRFYSGDMATLVLLESAAAEELKAVDPANQLLSASIQGGAFKELDQYFAAGGGRYADGIAYHFYALREEPEELINRIGKVREIMQKHGLSDKPLWNTEFGWLFANRDGQFGKAFNPDWSAWRKVSFEEGPGVIMRANLMALAGKVRTSIWYGWDNTAMGLSEAGAPKPAALAYTRLQEWVIGAEFEGCEQVSGVWRCRLSRNGAPAWIVWSKEKQQFQIPADWRVTKVQRYVAVPMGLDGKSVEIGQIPLYLAP